MNVSKVEPYIHAVVLPMASFIRRLGRSGNIVILSALGVCGISVQTSHNSFAPPTRVLKQVDRVDAIDESQLMIIGGSAHPALTQEISKILGTRQSQSTMKRYADGECSIQILDNIRGRDVFLIQTCAAPVNDNIMELLLTLSAVRRSGARRVTAVVPYFGYKHHRRGQLTAANLDARFLSSNAKDFAKMLTELGLDRVISVDLQRPGQGGEACFFDNQVPLETLVTTKMVTRELVRAMDGRTNNICVVAPNAECITRARKVQWELEEALPGRDVSFATYFDFDHFGAGPSDPKQIRSSDDSNNNVAYRDVIIVDDLVDTAGTASELARKLSRDGATTIFLVASHGIFSGDALESLAKSPVVKVFVTDSLPPPIAKNSLAARGLAKVSYVSLASNLADLINQEFRRSNQLVFESQDEMDDGAVEADFPDNSSTK